MVNKIYLNTLIAAIHALTTFRMFFSTFCYYFWGQHCCWTRNKHIGEEFFVFH